MAGEVDVYPAPPGAVPSPTFRVSVDGVAAFVERFGDVSHVRFAFCRAVEVEVRAEGPLGAHRVFPPEAAAHAEVRGDALRLVLAEPSSFVVWLGEREKLFVLADPIEPEDPPREPVVTVAPPAAGLATAAIQAAIDEVASHDGGGTVRLASGLHVSGTLRLRSHVTLHLVAGAILEGAPDPAAYPVDPGRVESGRDASLEPDRRFLGRTMTFSRLLLIDDATDVRIHGRGTIAGNGTLLRTRHGAVPNLVRVRNSRRVSIEDVLLRDAAAWTLHILACEDVSVRNVKILNDRDNLNTDGIDPDMSSNVTIDRAFVYTKDDAICVKASGNGGLTGDVRHVHVRDSVVSSRDAALKVGTESSADRFEDVSFERCWVFESGRAMSVVVRDGAVYERIAFRGITVDRGVSHLVEQVIGVRDPEAALGVIRSLSFEDVIVPEYVKPPDNVTWYTQFRPAQPNPGSPTKVFEGADAEHGVDGLLLRDVVVNGRHLDSAETAAEIAGLTIGRFVTGARFE